ncbi:MAG: hypothetical protein ACYS47_20895 [Planctomycetota bacterium]|jgi:hypothetical protein
MKPNNGGWIACAILLGILAWAPAARGEEKVPKTENGKKAKAVDLSRYKIIKYINPFSPDPPKKEKPPAPKVVKPPPKPPVKVKVEPKNLHFCGVTFDNTLRSNRAMVNVDGKGPRFLKPGDKVGAWEVETVGIDKIKVKGKDGKSRFLNLGERFHDGETVYWETKGGSSRPPSSPPSGASSPSNPPPASPKSGVKLDDAKRREIIERLKARRAAAKKKGK